MAQETSPLPPLLDRPGKARDIGFKTVLVFCCGSVDPSKGYHGDCHHVGRLALADPPDFDWYDISAHLKCTKCRLDRLRQYSSRLVRGH